MEIGKKLVDGEIFKNVFTGGEPLLRRGLVYHLAEFYSSNNIEVRLNSNLVLLKEEDCTRIKDSGIRGVFVGFPSSNEEIYNRLTSSNNYKNAIRGIELILKHGIPIAVNMVVNKINRNEVENTGAFLHALGIKSFAATPIIPCIYTGKELELDNNEIKQTLDTLLQLEKSFQMNVGIVETIPRCIFENTEKYERFFSRDCGAGRTTLAISSSGQVRPCTHSPLEYGNLLEKELSDIWDEMFEWRTEKFLPSECNSCSELDLCSIGCREAANYKFGSYNQKDPRANIDNVKNSRKPISKAINIKPRQKFKIVEGIKFREEQNGKLLFSPENSGIVYLNDSLFNFILYLKENQPFSVEDLNSTLNEEVYNTINFLNMKGVLKPW